MRRAVAFKPGMSLSTLQGQVNRFQALFGALAELGAQDGSTIAVFDGGSESGGKVVLRPGQAGPAGRETLVCTGDVFILGQLQQVSAYLTAA